jgi:hypothetical protein
VPRPTIVEIPPAEQARMRAELRRARYGYLLALHLLLLCAAGRTPSEVASVLFCSRSSVYRIVRAYRAGTLPFDETTEHVPQQRRLRLLPPVAQTLRPSPPQDCAPCLWLVSHAVELCHVGGDGPGPSWGSGVSRDHAPLAP